MGLAVRTVPDGLCLFHGLIQVFLKTSTLGSSVEEVELLIRKHETFQKVVTSQDEKVMGLVRVGWWESGKSTQFEMGDLGA